MDARENVLYRDLTPAAPGTTFPEKTEDSLHENVFTGALRRFRTITPPNYLMMFGWHNDVADVMVWLI